MYRMLFVGKEMLYASGFATREKTLFSISLDFVFVLHQQTLRGSLPSKGGQNLLTHSFSLPRSLHRISLS
jgi:hypothetical protein